MDDVQKVLVTGGGGFIGGHLVRTLLAAGHEVTVLDDFCTGDRKSLADLSEHPRLRVVQGDVTRPFRTEVTQIFHLACPASPVQYQRDPVKTLRTCVEGSIRMLELAQETGSAVLLASTSEVYGDPSVHPQAESYWGSVNPIGPRSCYDEGKRCAEALFFSYRSQHALRVKVARIFNTYGPGMQPHDGRVVSNFVLQALRGEPLTVFGDGGQTRSFCYVDDLVDGLVRLMNSPHEVTGPINLGNPSEVTMRDLAVMVMRLVTGREGRIEYHPLPVDDPRRRRPAVDRAWEVLGWRPETSLEEGLVRTIRAFRLDGQLPERNTPTWSR